MPSTSVHPHASGEHDLDKVTGLAEIGSSPREWGTLDAVNVYAQIGRFIPTRVGNTPSDSTALRHTAVHPHASGEHKFSRYSTRLCPGSSPREWGTREHCRFGNPVTRFIPTRVGNTIATSLESSMSSVHPHASGEHRIRLASHGNVTGSSPREWGTRQRFVSVIIRGRFIPTRVGNTL